MTTLAAALTDARNLIWDITADNSDRMESLRKALSLHSLDLVAENPADVTDAEYMDTLRNCAETLTATASTMSFMAPRADMTRAVVELAHMVRNGLYLAAMHDGVIVDAEGGERYPETTSERRAIVAAELAREVNPYRAAIGLTIAELVA